MTMQKLCSYTQYLTHNNMLKVDYFFLYTVYGSPELQTKQNLDLCIVYKTFIRSKYGIIQFKLIIISACKSSKLRPIAISSQIRTLQY